MIRFFWRCGDHAFAAEVLGISDIMPDARARQAQDRLARVETIVRELLRVVGE